MDLDPIALSPQPDKPDDLGLDDTIKIASKQRKRAKIDDDRLLNRPAGLPSLIKHYKKVSRTFERNDKKTAKAIGKASLASSKKALKLAGEYRNLETVLQFYQMWCHGLFPKATFQDCIHLLRAQGAKPGVLRVYRRGLIDQEITKYKRDHGMIVESELAQDNDVYAVSEPIETRAGGEAEDDDNVDNDDFFSFMTKRNGLFVDSDDEDDDPTTEAGAEAPANPNESTEAAKAPAAPDKSTEAGASPAAPHESEEDPFSDDDDMYAALGTQPSIPPAQPDEFPDEADLFDAEEEVMREMGM